MLPLIILLGLSLTAPSFAIEKSPFINIQDTLTSLGFTPYYSLTPIRQASVAILDQDFYGYEKEIGVTLPKNTKYYPGPLESPEPLKNIHGRVMAQILTAAVSNNGKNEQLVPNLYLYNVYGFTNFKSAITDIIDKKIDIVLYSEVWEYGSNWDGKGFFNQEVNRALKAGIIWVNAAGNFNNRTYNTAIVTDENSWVRLPDTNKSLAIKCESKKENEKCHLRVVLSWNDFNNDVDSGTSKDLDLALTDDMLNIIQTAGLKQSDDPKENRPGYSKYPREILVTEIDPGTYYLRVKNRSNNFKPKDMLRITVDGDFITMPSHSSGESLLNPADNKDVITVGASDSDRSSSSFKLQKPELMAPSALFLSKDKEYRGSSNSAAFVASGLAILKSLNPANDRNELLKLISKRSPGSHNGGSGHGPWLGFGFTGSGCFREATPPANIPEYIRSVLDQGGTLVQTTLGVRIMVNFDPITLDSQMYRRSWDDMIVVTPRGYRIYPRLSSVPSDAVEVFETPERSRLCGTPNTEVPSFTAIFSMPTIR